MRSTSIWTRWIRISRTLRFCQRCSSPSRRTFLSRWRRRSSPCETPDPALLAKLQVPIARLSLPKMPLGDAVQVLSALGSLPISFDPEAMEELGVSLDNAVTVNVPRRRSARPCERSPPSGTSPEISVNQVLLTSPAEYRQRLETRPMPVADLTGRDVRAATDLANLLQRLVVPESWQANGGRGTVETGPDALRIAQTGHVQLPGPRLLRQASPGPRLAAERSHIEPKNLVLTTRTARGRTSCPGREPERRCTNAAFRHHRAVQAAGGN